MDEGGQWSYDPKYIKGMTVRFFENLFKKEGEHLYMQERSNLFNRIPQEHTEPMKMEISKEKVYQALFEMGPYKAPGPDGFQPVFFQKHWDIVGQDLLKFVQGVYEGKEDNAKINQTFLVLIPKIPKPEHISQFWPIGLCNTIYKLVTKSLVNKIKSALPHLISINQSSFVSGRHIIDNIIIAQEMIHTMRNLKGKKGFMALKFDLEKAYDRLHWSFIKETLVFAGFPSSMINLIMECITTASLQVLWNGKPMKVIKPSRGIRQGDLLSPYIFVLCLERFSQDKDRSSRK